jgi:hypothetical protein
MTRTVLVLLALSGAVAHAQDAAPKQQAQTASTTALVTTAATGGTSSPTAGTATTVTPPPATGQAAPTPTAGQGRPPIIIPAFRDSATVRLQLQLPALPQKGDLEFGQLTSEQNSTQRIIPSLDLIAATGGKDSPVDLQISIGGLVAFGDSTAPLLYQGRQMETLRFHKTGLNVKQPPEGPIVSREQDQTLLLVLENPSAFEYPMVRARLRFQDRDVCAVSVDRDSETPKGSCQEANSWSSFSVPRFSQVSLRAPKLPDWYRDPGTGRARSALRRGTLTLRYQGDKNAVLEQNLPIEVRFDPSGTSLTFSIARVGFWLVIGALVSLLLRVSIPNYRRKKALKDQLEDARRATSEISDQVDSQLRVLLRVERLALDQRRREGWVVGPGFGETANRVEAGIKTLIRKIALVQRLDASACRRDALLEGPTSPTRAALIDDNLNLACEGLKSDQLAEADWLFIQHHLEAADKALNEPSQEEKQAFEALLSQRWKTIRDHFTLDQQTHELVVPDALKPMANCFPDGQLLPRADDEDGTKWIASVGVVRADLQLTALQIIGDVQFLAPALNGGSSRWDEHMGALSQWLATPALANLAAARRQIRQLAEGICEKEIVGALQAGAAEIDIDPRIVNPNQTVRIMVRFRDPRINSAIARGGIVCQWSFNEPQWTTLLNLRRTRKPEAAGNGAQGHEPAADQNESPEDGQVEYGWRVHRYFEPGILRQPVEARFYWDGEPVCDKSGKPVTFQKVIVPRERVRHRKDQWEKWVWRPMPQALQLLAALLVPLAALALTTAGESGAGEWWDLVGLGFGSETIRNILTGPPGGTGSTS